MNKLFVKVICAEDLKGADVLSGTSDPYVEVRIKNHSQHYKTKVIKNTRCPHWNEEFVLYPSDILHDVLLFKIYDYNLISTNELIGEIEIPVNTIINKGLIRESRPVMKRISHNNFKIGHGRITFEFEYGTKSATTTVISQTLPYSTSSSHLTYGSPYQTPQYVTYQTPYTAPYPTQQTSYATYPGQTSYTPPAYSAQPTTTTASPYSTYPGQTPSYTAAPYTTPTANSYPYPPPQYNAPAIQQQNYTAPSYVPPQSPYPVYTAPPTAPPSNTYPTYPY